MNTFEFRAVATFTADRGTKVTTHYAKLTQAEFDVFMCGGDPGPVSFRAFSSVKTGDEIVLMRQDTGEETTALICSVQATVTVHPTPDLPK